MSEGFNRTRAVDNISINPTTTFIPSNTTNSSRQSKPYKLWPFESFCFKLLSWCLAWLVKHCLNKSTACVQNNREFQPFFYLCVFYKFVLGFNLCQSLVGFCLWSNIWECFNVWSNIVSHYTIPQLDTRAFVIPCIYKQLNKFIEQFHVSKHVQCLK